LSEPPGVEDRSYALAVAVLDTIPNLVMVLDREGRIVRCNRAFERALGYPLAEARGRVPWEAFVVPEEAGAVRAAFASLLASRAPGQHENRWRTRDGELRLLSWSDTAILDAAGEVEHVVGTATDVTERHWAEEDLLRTNQALRTLIEASPLAICALDRDGIVQVWSPAAERIFGWTRREVLGKAIPSVPDERRDELREVLRRTFAGEPLSGAETVRHRKDGTPVDVAIWTSLLRGPQDEPESLLAVIADVGDRKRAEEELRRREEQLRLITDSVPALISYVDTEQRHRFNNRQYEVWFGRPREEVYGRTVPELLGEEAYAEIRPHLEGALAGRPASFETWIPMSWGDRYVHGDFVPDRDEEGVVRGFFALISDITDRRHAEEELRKAKEAVEAASQAKDQFLAVLSHELRTPLTPVLATVSTLETQASLAGDLRKGLAMIRRNVELEARLIDDLLDLTRIARGKLELHPQWVDACEILNHAILICCTPEVASGRLRLEMGLTPGDHRVWADGPRLTQVFWNLLNNAVKFTSDGGSITVRSRIEEDETGHQLVVEVSDTGIGIEPESLARVFDAFEQADRRITRRFGGLGLGLAVSKAILELHRGSLTAASAGRGFGATFTARLPIGLPGERPADADAESSRSDFTAPATPAAGRALRLLLVEDHADTAEAMADLLGLLGHQVRVAGSVAAALAAAEAASASGGLDLVVSDLGLPDGSGLDLMPELVRRYGLKGIALSGYGMEEDLRKSREAGFALHLTKPVTLQALKAAIGRVAPAAG
jgi:two-component system, chemotaxis family, CheB/CheR fusion protein